MAYVYVIIAVVLFIVLMLASPAIRSCRSTSAASSSGWAASRVPKAPGLFFIWQIVDKMTRIDLRVVTHEVPPQEVIARDNVTVKVAPSCSSA